MHTTTYRIRLLRKVTAALTLLAMMLVPLPALHCNTFSIKENPEVTKALEETFGDHLPESYLFLEGGFSSPGIYKIERLCQDTVSGFNDYFLSFKI